MSVFLLQNYLNAEPPSFLPKCPFICLSPDAHCVAGPQLPSPDRGSSEVPQSRTAANILTTIEVSRWLTFPNPQKSTLLSSFVQFFPQDHRKMFSPYCYNLNVSMRQLRCDSSLSWLEYEMRSTALWDGGLLARRLILGGLVL